MSGTATTLGSSAATLAGAVIRAADSNAYQGFELSAFGSTSADSISWTASVAASDEIDYTWDEQNRLQTATRLTNGLPTYQAGFTYNSMGWQVQSQTVHDYTRNVDDVRSFGYGFGGELLGETIGNGGIRDYVNAGLDRVLWTNENGPNTSRFWLTDLNGSVFAITDPSAAVLERQRFDAFGRREVLDPAGVLLTTGTKLNNRTGFDGCTDIWEVGLQNRRHRFYDPSIGRFINRDPLGFVDGAAWYNYCHGDPVNGA